MKEKTLKTIYDVFVNICNEKPNKIAAIFPDESKQYTFMELKDLVDKTTKALISLGIEKGSHVAICMHNTDKWLAVLYAASSIGAIVVPVNINSSVAEMEYLIAQADVNVLFYIKNDSKNNNESLKNIIGESNVIDKGKFIFLDKVIVIGDVISTDSVINWSDFISRSDTIFDDIVYDYRNKVTAEDIYSIQYTSGTTSRPKGAILAQKGVLFSASNYGEVIEMSSDEKILIPIPFHYCFGNILTAVSYLIYGATIVVPSGFNTTSTLRILEEERCTLICGVPTMYFAMINNRDFNKYDLSKLNKIVMGGSYSSPSQVYKISQAFGVTNIINGYGLTETSSLCVVPSINEPFEMRVNTVGRHLPNIEAKIVGKDNGDENQEGQMGELLIRGCNCMLGYYKKEYETSQTIDKDGWLHTGDLASQTHDGWIKIEGRIKDIIIRGGENISPTEIEIALCEVEDINDAKVIGINDEVMGEKIAAIIIGRINLEDLCQRMETKLENKISKNKIPEYYIKVDAYPVNSNGKVIKDELKRMVQKLIDEKKFDEQNKYMPNSKRRYKLYQ